MRCIALTTLLLLAACDSAPPAMSQDVRAFLQRRQDCQHWAGEEGYDAARRAQINAAYARLRCAALEEDEAALRARHKDDATALRSLGQAPAPTR